MEDQSNQMVMFSFHLIAQRINIADKMNTRITTAMIIFILMLLQYASRLA